MISINQSINHVNTKKRIGQRVIEESATLTDPNNINLVIFDAPIGWRIGCSVGNAGSGAVIFYSVDAPREGPGSYFFVIENPYSSTGKSAIFNSPPLCNVDPVTENFQATPIFFDFNI